MNALSDEASTMRARSVWLLWIAVSAIGAVASALFNVSYQRIFGSHFAGQAVLSVIGMLVLLLAPPVFQAALLRRMFPQARLIWWAGLSWLSGLLVLGAMTRGWTHGIYKAELAFEVALFRSSALVAWMQLAAIAGLWPLAFVGLPILALGAALKRSPILLLVSTIVSGAVSVLLFKLYSVGFYIRMRSLLNPIDYNQAQQSWRELAMFAVAIAAFAMISGAIQGFGLIYMFRQVSGDAAPLKKTASAALPIFGLVALMLVATHGVRAALGPRNFVADFLGSRMPNLPIPSRTRDRNIVPETGPGPRTPALDGAE